MSVPRTVGRRPCVPGRLGISRASNADPAAVRLVTTSVLLAIASAFVLLLAAFAAGVSSAGSGDAAAAAGNGRVTIINQRGAARDRPTGISAIDRRGRFAFSSGAVQRKARVVPLVEHRLGPRWYRLCSRSRRSARSAHTTGFTSSTPVRAGSRHLPRDGFDIDWSPDRSRFAYVEFTRFANPIGSIYMVRADGSGRTRLPNRERGSGQRRLPGLPAARDWRTKRTLPGSIRSGCATASCRWSA